VGTSGASYTVAATTNFSSNWTILGAPVETAAGQFKFTDAQAINLPRRFYRVSLP
jgi:hypothetical protein